MAHKINELVEKIKNLSETEYYRIKIEEKSPEITDSKIGGLPYWLEGKEFPTDEENVILIQVMVSDADMGRVIGRNGRTANAIRTLVQASSSLTDNKYVKIDIDKF